MFIAQYNDQLKPKRFLYYCVNINITVSKQSDAKKKFIGSVQQTMFEFERHI